MQLAGKSTFVLGKLRADDLIRCAPTKRFRTKEIRAAAARLNSARNRRPSDVQPHKVSAVYVSAV